MPIPETGKFLPRDTGLGPRLYPPSRLSWLCAPSRERERRERVRGLQSKDLASLGLLGTMLGTNASEWETVWPRRGPVRGEIKTAPAVPIGDNDWSSAAARLPGEGRAIGQLLSCPAINPFNSSAAELVLPQSCRTETLTSRIPSAYDKEWSYRCQASLPLLACHRSRPSKRSGSPAFPKRLKEQFSWLRRRLAKPLSFSLIFLFSPLLFRLLSLFCPTPLLSLGDASPRFRAHVPRSTAPP